MSQHSYRLIEVTRYTHVCVVTFQKRLVVNEDDVRDLKADLDYIRHNLRAATMLFDFEEVDFLCEDALLILFSFQGELRKRRQSMTLCRLQFHIDLTLRMFGFNRSFTFSDGAELPTDYILAHAHAA